MGSDKTLQFFVESYKYAALSFAIMSLKLMINHQKVQPKDNYMVLTLISNSLLNSIHVNSNLVN